MLYYLITGFILFLGLIYLDSIGYLDEEVNGRLLNPLKEWEEFWNRFKESFKFCFKNIYGTILFIVFILTWPLVIITIILGIAYRLFKEEKEEEVDYEEE